MPQIDQLAETFSSQAFWLLVFFGISFFVVGRGMVPKVSGTMERRSKQIADDITAAQAARDQADKEEEAWRVRENENRAKAQELIAEAKAKAAAETESKLATAQKGFDAKLETAEARIAEAREKAAALGVRTLGRRGHLRAEDLADLLRDRVVSGLAAVVPGSRARRRFQHALSF